MRKRNAESASWPTADAGLPGAAAACIFVVVRGSGNAFCAFATCVASCVSEQTAEPATWLVCGASLHASVELGANVNVALSSISVAAVPDTWPSFAKNVDTRKSSVSIVSEPGAHADADFVSCIYDAFVVNAERNGGTAEHCRLLLADALAS